MVKKAGILDRNLSKTRASEVSLNAFAFLFSEMVQYSQKRVGGITDLEKKLSDYGYRVGVRVLELTMWRDKNAKRETRVLGILYFINTTIWKTLFGKPAGFITKEHGIARMNVYMIIDNDPMVNRFISIPRELSTLNTGAFIAGVIEAVLDGNHFPSRVSAHSTATDEHPLKMTILIKFDKSGKASFLPSSFFPHHHHHPDFPSKLCKCVWCGFEN
ncbi:NO signaling/Golgi transport ligand-binding domain-containing protein [Chytridium lagenaria]|nr:NO signaling/Golgi transport ligand-binding domain-containing protein [Chytridium lagenaria]